MELNLGIRAHDIQGQETIDGLAKEIAGKGLTAVQLALGKSFPDLNTSVGSLSPGLARHIGDQFKKNDVQIAVLGCYIHMIHPDKEKRQSELERFKEHIRFARDFGCSIVGTETGNVHEKTAYTEDNFEEQPFLDVVESVRELVEEAEKFGVIVAIEAGINHPVHTAQKLRRLIDLIDSPNLQVILDPANLLDPYNYERQEEVFQEAMDLLGDHIVIMHAKDFIIDENGWVKMVPVGTGLLNYDAVFKLIKPKKPHLNVLLEATQEPHIDASIEFLRKKYAEA
ncbi:sugar phosphate isomerase/epimerase family protein [Sporosarcina ureilytica]|uniref:AP endonuclease n=1 Tax=Sporosarcina ureilytica TaxID=298596 RepID=A0A1D8JIT3_9BACL|nr:sugar phosphate isomerase/epimerase family protein [Sporosarcina ureilytica]AOV08615.1 AP endonuclease [Sporosarcina ureilytica]